MMIDSVKKEVLYSNNNEPTITEMTFGVLMATIALSGIWYATSLLIAFMS